MEAWKLFSVIFFPGLLPEQRYQLLPQGIPHLSKNPFTAGTSGRVREADMHDLGFPGKQGALFLGLVADGDHQVELLPGQIVH